MENNFAQLYIPNPKTEKAAIRWRLNLIAMGVDNFGPHLTKRLEKDIAKAMDKQLDSKGYQFWLDIANSGISEIDEVEYAILYFAGRLFETQKITEKQVLDLYPPAQKIIDAKGKIKKKSKRIERIILVGKFDLGVTKIYFRNIQLPIIRANLALLELLAIIIPNVCIPKLVALTPKYLSSSYIHDWIRSLQYEKKFGNAEEKGKARNALKQFGKAIEGDARGNQIRNYGYWHLNRYYQWLSMNILKYRNALANKSVDHSKILNKILKTCPVPEECRHLLSSTRPNPKPVALEIMTAIGLVNDPKAFLNYQAKINRLKKKHQLDLCLGSSGATPLLEDYLDSPTLSPKLVFKQNLFAVLETI